MNVLIVIPARGGSKGIPRKNLRTLAGKPLLYYSVHTALRSSFKPDVYVSSDDEEIIHFAGKLGALTHQRSPQLADDKATLDPVIFDAYRAIREKNKKEYDIIVTMQPTSPLLSVQSLDEAIRFLISNKHIDTVIAARNDTHLTWKKEHDAFLPNYEKRMNRQYLTPVFRETGGFLITRSNIISENNRIGEKVHLYELGDGEQIDIDSTEDWNLCAYYLRRKRIVIAVSGYPQIGMGHVYNMLSIANDIMDHDISFITDRKSELAFNKINASNYKVSMQQKADIADDILALSPDVVINDMLDTSAVYVKKLKRAGVAVINFEDLGPGAAYADLVINAMYPEKKKRPCHFSGEKYFCLKNEFFFARPKKKHGKVKRVLLTFGGVDPNNYTAKVISSIGEYCLKNKIAIDVVAGLGYDKYDSLSVFNGISIHRNVPDISEYISNADIVFTSAGRTTFEVASLGVPCIVMAQNARELTHFFCKPSNGFVNLGLGTQVSAQRILHTFSHLAGNVKKRRDMNLKMLSFNLAKGKERVLQLLSQTINKQENEDH